ncbi:MAG: hypothetical protein L0Y37_04505 [Bacteroidales bacterium]|nr:hypothetical protein [Bacteroidales bacterium]
MKSDNEYPHLVPPDDTFPGQENMFRSPHDLTAEQFSLLAAAWAEGALSGESLSEIESVIAADREKRVIAESFRRLRLKPGTERWEGRNRLLRSTPAAKNVRRIFIYTIATAAAILAIMTLRPVAEQREAEQTLAVLPGVTVTADMPGSVTHDIQMDSEMPPAESHQVMSEPVILIASAEIEEMKRDMPLEIGIAAESNVIISEINAKNLIALQIRAIPPPSEAADERSWIVNSLAALSKSGTNEDKPVNSYTIAGSLVKSVNSLLGWEMELEKVTTDEGEPVAVNFNSGLLTFSSPVKKSNQ